MAATEGRRNTSQHESDDRLAAVASMEYHSPVEEVIARVALAVDLGLLVPGERLPHKDSLAATFNVSPTTVRRALTRLCELGVLERLPGRHGGTFVEAVPRRNALVQFEPYRKASDSVIELIDHRRVLESGNAMLAAKRATSADIKRLRAYVRAMDQAETWPEFRAADPRFHLEIAAIAGSSGAVNALSDLLSSLYQYYVPYPLEYLRKSNIEHKQIVDAIEAGDGPSAVSALGRHLSEVAMTMVPTEQDHGSLRRRTTHAHAAVNARSDRSPATRRSSPGSRSSDVRLGTR